MKIKSYTVLRNDYNTISTLTHETQEPIYITKNGEGDIVLMLIVGLLWPASVISTCFKLRYREA